MLIEIIVVIAATLALINWLLFGSLPVNTFHFYFGLALLILTINSNNKKEKK